MQYDVAIIGAGVVGSMIARALSQYELNTVVLERHAEPAEETSAANSGIVHAGYDAKPGSWKAKLKVRGNAMMEELCREMDVPFRRTGSLVLAFDEADCRELERLYAYGQQNGVPGLKILSREEVLRRETAVSENVQAALYAETAGIVCPYELTQAALEVACTAGTEFLREFQVASIVRYGAKYVISAVDGRTIEAGMVVNAAGVFSDRIAAMVGDNSFSIRPRKGQYILFEHTLGDYVSSVIFQTPRNGSKGVLVAPTVDRNLFIGPNADYVPDPEDVSTTPAGLDEIAACARKSVKNIDMKLAITNFAGLRASSTTRDFVLTNPEPGFFNAAGIESPGLSASPAIAEHIVEMMRRAGLVLKKKEGWTGKRKPVARFREMGMEERQKKIAEDPAYGKMVCRCETVTEGEIREAIRRPAGARTVDGVKRRTRAGMGRCQGGFCSPRVMEILAQELGCGLDEITKFGGASRVLLGKSR